MADVLKITFTGGDKELGDDQTLSLAQPILVGRSHTANIRLAEEDVSGRHLLITRESDGIWVENLSKGSRTLVNGQVFASGERRPLAVGDVISMGRRARFRIDAAGESSAASAAKDATLATGFTRPTASATSAWADGTRATVATHLTTTATQTTRGPETLATTAFDSDTADVLEGTVPSAEDDDETGPLPFDGETDTRALGPVPPSSADSVTTGVSPADDRSTDGDPDSGLTQEMKTRPMLQDEIARQKWLYEQRKKFRQLLISFSTLLFLSLLGTVVWLQWPKKERVLSVPQVTATKECDLDNYTMKNAEGPVFLVDFPRDGRMTKKEDAEGAGIEVSTFTGRDRDVPFSLKASRTASADELMLSLAASADAQKKRLAAREGYVFLSPADWPAGEFFFESAYPVSCHSPRLMRGSRFSRSEYEIIRSGRKWHGVWFWFRDGETAYQLQHEIPESEWVRGASLLRKDPNLEFYPDFLEQRWESPGREGLVRGADVNQLLTSVSDELALVEPRVVNWPWVKQALDTLMVRTWQASPGEQKRVRDLYARFRKQQDVKYLRFRVQFENAKTLGSDGVARMQEVRENCRSVFGEDRSDRRFELINDLENWSCQVDH